MALHVIRKGLDLPISGGITSESVESAPPPSHVAVLAQDYHGVKPSFAVQVGDTVKRGQALFRDKARGEVVHTSPAAGRVAAIHRGERRALISVVIELAEEERNSAPPQQIQATFEAYTGRPVNEYTSEQIAALLAESGLWTAFRTRPFSRTPRYDSRPHSIFVTAIDTQPLAPPLNALIRNRENDIETGLQALQQFFGGTLFYCTAPNAAYKPKSSPRVRVEEFTGPHPSGLVGLHIHLLDPVHAHKSVWHIGIQDLIAIGHLFRTGVLDVSRIIALAGPAVTKPTLLKTRLGTSVDSLVAGRLAEGEVRVISGSVLSGATAIGPVTGYLGRFHQQVSVIFENRKREFLGWLKPGGDLFSISNLFTSALSRGTKKFNLDTSMNGSRRAMVPMGYYERVMPMDVIPTYLLRAIVMGDVERAEQLGCLELDEEDLALCSFVCPGKYEYGTYLRRLLTQIEKEG